MGGIGEAPHPCYGRYTGRAPAAFRGGRVVLRELMRMRTSSEGAERAIADYLIAHRSRLGSLDAPVAAITSFCGNSLSGLSNVVLYVSSRVKRRGRATGIATSFKKQRFRLL